MFYVIYIFVIAFALYLIFHDRFGEEGQRKSLSSGPSAHTIPPEPQARVPLSPERPEQQPVKPAPRPVREAPKPGKPNTVPTNPAPRIVPPAPARPAVPTYVVQEPGERELSWSYLYKLEYDEALVQADELGVSLGSILRIQSAQVRARRFERAERLANEAPVKLLAPLMLFIFPAVFLILLGPVFHQMMHRL